MKASIISGSGTAKGQSTRRRRNRRGVGRPDKGKVSRRKDVQRPRGIRSGVFTVLSSEDLRRSYTVTHLRPVRPCVRTDESSTTFTFLVSASTSPTGHPPSVCTHSGTEPEGFFSRPSVVSTTPTSSRGRPGIVSNVTGLCIGRGRSTTSSPEVFDTSRHVT